MAPVSAAKLRGALELFDKGKAGALTLDELVAILTRPCSNVAYTEEAARTKLASLAVDGKITIATLVSAWIRSDNMASRVKTIFDSIDKAGDGTITRAELAVKLSQDDELEQLLGDSAAKESLMGKIRAVMKADEDGDQAVSWAEFQSLLCA